MVFTIGGVAFNWQSASLILISISMLYVFIQMVKLMWPDKEHKYTGETNASGNYHGRGRLEAVNGDIYEGDFHDGKFHGSGHYIFKNGGGHYKGQFKNGQFCGRGREVYPDGSMYEGDFLAGKRFRRGTITYLNGTKFTGDWQYGRKQGKGSMHYNDGTRFEGYFADGKRQGLGVLRDANGRKMIGLWADGRLLIRLDHLPYNCTPRSACHDRRLLALLAVHETFVVEEDTDMEEVGHKIERDRGESLAKCIIGVQVLTEDGQSTRPVIAAPLPTDGSEPMTADEAAIEEAKQRTEMVAASAAPAADDVDDKAARAAALAARVAAANGTNRRRPAKNDASSSSAPPTPST